MLCFASPAFYLGSGASLGLWGVTLGGGQEEGIVCCSCRNVVACDVWLGGCKREGLACVGCDLVIVRDAGMSGCGAAVVVGGGEAELLNVHAATCSAGFLVYDSKTSFDFVSAKGFTLCGLGCFNGATAKVMP